MVPVLHKNLLVKKAASNSTDIDKSDKNTTKANLEDLNFLFLDLAIP
jgi:hypothetical protein